MAIRQRRNAFLRKTKYIKNKDSEIMCSALAELFRWGSSVDMPSFVCFIASTMCNDLHFHSVRGDTWALQIAVRMTLVS